jgi:hypothetical protein
VHQPLCVFIVMVFLAGTAHARCEARSGPRTAVLVELYTAQGCGSCLPADRWLSGLSGSANVVAVALHVAYRDYVDSEPVRRKFTPLQRLALVHTPRVLLQGREFTGWGSRAFDLAVERINARPARARIGLRAEKAGPRTLEIRVEAQVLEPDTQAALYISAYQNRLDRRVVLEWRGPLELPAGARMEQRHSLPLLPGAMPADSGVAAFVQDRRTAEVLQALLLPACFS